MRILTWNEKLGKAECPYLHRWALNFGIGSIRLHHWIRSDDKRAPHDHPWWFVTLVLKGSYTDRTFLNPDSTPMWETDKLQTGAIRYRPANHRHIVDVTPGGCWTLMITGKKIRNWGFWVPRKNDGVRRFIKSNRYFLEHGHHPCDQL
jgi:hypothetical protein